MHHIIVVLTVATIASASLLEVRECSHVVGKLEEVRSAQVKNGKQVILQAGNTYNFTITFIAGENSDLLTSEMHTVLHNVRTPLGVAVNENACSSLTKGSCPLVAGHTYIYSSGFKLRPDFPRVKLEFDWQLISTTKSGVLKKTQICFRIPALIH